jgi:stage II sporulation protein M
MKKIRKKGAFIDNYKRSWKFIKESRKFIFIIIGIFLFFTLVGFFIPAPSSISEWILKYIENVMDETAGFSAVQLISFIFFNNLKSSFAGMILGILLGIFPIFVAVFNGYILGFVMSESVKANGILILWRLLPHGIFELPAVFISLGLGLKIGTNLVFNRKKGGLRKDFHDSLKVFLFVIIPLLILAAIIEGMLIAFAG